MAGEGFVWYGPGDAGHFEYHPGVNGLIKGNALIHARDKAIAETGSSIGCMNWRSQLWQDLD